MTAGDILTDSDIEIVNPDYDFQSERCHQSNYDCKHCRGYVPADDASKDTPQLEHLLQILFIHQLQKLTIAEPALV